MINYENAVAAVSTQIKRAMKNRQLSHRQLANIAGVSSSDITLILDGVMSPRAVQFEAVICSVGLPIKLVDDLIKIEDGKVRAGQINPKV